MAASVAQDSQALTSADIAHGYVDVRLTAGIALKDIVSVQRIESSWIMKKELHYFEVCFLYIGFNWCW